MHYQYFPQIRQALSEADDKYLGEAAPPAWLGRRAGKGERSRGAI